MGPGDDVIAKMRNLLTREFEEDVDINKQISIGEYRVRCVQHLSLAIFRRLLVNLVAILFSHDKTVWPKKIHKSCSRIAVNGN